MRPAAGGHKSRLARRCRETSQSSQARFRLPSFVIVLRATSARMVLLKWALLVLLAGYAGAVVLMYLAQRQFMYFADPQRVDPAAAGLPQADAIVLPTADGEELIAWHVPCMSSPAAPKARSGRWSGISRSPRRTLRELRRSAPIIFYWPTFRLRFTRWW